MIGHLCEQGKHGVPPDANVIPFACSGYASDGGRIGACECGCHKTKEELAEINKRAREAARNPKGRPWQ